MDAMGRPPTCETDRIVGQLVPLLWELGQRLRDHMMSATAAVGLPGPATMALRALDPEIPRPMNELAGALHCDRSNVTGIADQLEARGLVRRQPSPGDRRVKELVVTEEGRAVRDRFVRELERVPLRIEALDEEEQATLIDLLSRLLDASPCDAHDAATARNGPGGLPSCGA